MKAVIVEKPGQVVIRETESPKTGHYSALVRMEAGCLCNSTDTKLVNGHFPGLNDYPIILGHEGVGRVVETGPKVRSFKPGQKVIGALNLGPAERGLNSGWGAFAEYALIGDHQAMYEDGVADREHDWYEVYQIMKPVPDDIPDEEAVLMCTWREVLGGFSDFCLESGKSIIIFGGGPVGQSFVRIAKLRRLSPIVMSDRIDWKMNKAVSMGADFTIEADAPDFIDRVRQLVPEGYDFVLDAIGLPSVMNLGMKLVRMGGNICVYGTVPEDEITINKSQGPYNWNLLFHQWPTRAYESDAHSVLCNMILSQQIKAEEFITHRYSIRDINKALEEVKKGKTLKVFLKFDW